MTRKQKEHLEFTGFGMQMVPETASEDAVYILAVYRDGVLTAAAHATERGAMEAAVEYLSDELEESDEGGTLQDRFARVQGYIADDGGVMALIPGPIYQSSD